MAVSADQKTTLKDNHGLIDAVFNYIKEAAARDDLAFTNAAMLAHNQALRAVADGGHPASGGGAPNAVTALAAAVAAIAP